MIKGRVLDMFHIFLESKNQDWTCVNHCSGGNQGGCENAATCATVSSLEQEPAGVGQDATFRGIGYYFQVWAPLKRYAGFTLLHAYDTREGKIRIAIRGLEDD